jgi:hypothetical protein
MSFDLRAGLLFSERMMLRVVRIVVPKAERADWIRAWEAELWHLHHPHPRQVKARSASGLTAGILSDALWLRTECCKQALRGTATLCLLSLITACLTVALIAFLVTGDLHVFGAHTSVFGTHASVFFIQAPLVVFVTFATTSRRHIQDSTSLRPIHRLRRQLFFAMKVTLVLTLAFLLSSEIAEPAHLAYPLASDLAQTLLAVLLSIVGLRWAMLDQQERCKHCLLALTSPARVGRPSYNLLEWNGTEQICRHGHGLLSNPEMETSWCSHSRWVEQVSDQKQLA